MQILYNIPDTLLPASVASVGFFDGVHRGHRYLIDQVLRKSRQEEVASMVITFPVHPRKVIRSDYQPQLLTTGEEKLQLLAETGVDYCIMLDFTPELAALTAREFMLLLKERFQVKGLLLGYDHRFGKDREADFSTCVQIGNGIGMHIYQEEAYEIGEINISSSVIRSLLAEGEVAMAGRCLGYPYSLEGRVVDGYKVGRTIGYPTANLRSISPDKLIPALGVYAVYAEVEGKIYRGMLNIGHRPTLDNGNHTSVEVHILDFSGDIYRQQIRVQFMDHLRSEKRFRNVQELIRQLQKDESQIRENLPEMPEDLF
ncbi:MAG: bifunctional riboflavin kinase/FAD synthetase [Bacteroides sp.]|nr:bifunctional riboflavin kinase/FAD synthetase [Bacteroides sp.]